MKKDILELNKIIVEIFNIIQRFGNKEIKNSLKTKNTEAKILSKKRILLRITKNSIFLFNFYNIQNKIISKKHQKECSIEIEKVKDFLHGISTSIKRINHIGVSYSCKDYSKEIKEYLKVTNPPFKLFQEESGSKQYKWYFIGDKTNWKNTFFEIVLNNNLVLDQWIRT